jgi:hypothetical protein
MAQSVALDQARVTAAVNDFLNRDILAAVDPAYWQAGDMYETVNNTRQKIHHPGHRSLLEAKSDYATSLGR